MTGREAARRWLAVLVAAAGALAGCSGAPTEVRVLVHVELPADAIDTVRVQVDRSAWGMADESRSIALSDTEGPPELTVRQTGPRLGPLVITVEGLRDGAARIRRTRTTEFRVGQIRWLPFVLSASCLDVPCPTGASCEAGECRTLSIDGRRDAGPPGDDAGDDAGEGPRECPAGRQTCGPACRCPAECTCDLGCRGEGTCRPVCAPGASCEIDVAPADAAQIDCRGATCRVRADERRDVRVDCAGGDCEVDCEEAERCLVRCGGGARCRVQCDDASDCEVEGCGAGLRRCDDDVLVCNGSC